MRPFLHGVPGRGGGSGRRAGAAVGILLWRRRALGVGLGIVLWRWLRARGIGLGQPRNSILFETAACTPVHITRELTSTGTCQQSLILIAHLISLLSLPFHFFA